VHFFHTPPTLTQFPKVDATLTLRPEQLIKAIKAFNTSAVLIMFDGGMGRQQDHRCMKYKISYIVYVPGNKEVFSQQ
jgi:hypothetical protein